MRSFTYENPVKVLFGTGELDRLGEVVRGRYRRVLLVCAEGPVAENGTKDRAVALIRGAGAQVIEMGGIASNPKLASVYEGVQAAQSAGADCVVALGGGSAMDCAKLIAVSAKTGVDPYEYLWGSRPVATASLDTIMVPTIAATGTELNDTAVIVNEKTREKYWCVCAYPKVCIMDPALTLSLPPRMTVFGTMDILSHTFEYYFNGAMDSEFQLCLSEALVTGIMRAQERLTRDPGDVEARGELLWCSTVTWGTGLTKIGRGEPDMTCHSIEESFSGYFDTHHGGCLGVLTPRWMLKVAGGHSAIFARFARRVMGVVCEDDAGAARLGIEAYVRWLNEVNAPQTYADLAPGKPFTDEELMLVADNAWRIYHGSIGRLQNMTLDDIREILHMGKTPVGTLTREEPLP